MQRVACLLAQLLQGSRQPTCVQLRVCSRLVETLVIEAEHGNPGQQRNYGQQARGPGRGSGRRGSGRSLGGRGNGPQQWQLQWQEKKEEGEQGEEEEDVSTKAQRAKRLEKQAKMQVINPSPFLVSSACRDCISTVHQLVKAVALNKRLELCKESRFFASLLARGLDSNAAPHLNYLPEDVIEAKGVQTLLEKLAEAHGISVLDQTALEKKAKELDEFGTTRNRLEHADYNTLVKRVEEARQLLATYPQIEQRVPIVPYIIDSFEEVVAPLLRTLPLRDRNYQQR